MRLFRFVLPAAIILAACGGPANVQKTDCAKDSECDDTNACTNDTCSAGKCIHSDVTVDDGNVCTADSCDPSAGVKHDAVAVDDGNACTTDACDPVAGVSHTAVATDDGNACTTDSCDPATGVKHVAVATDDGDACTTDACDPATGVTHTAVTTDDNDVCTTDACDPSTGVSHTAVATDDGNACTTDACDPTTGVSHTPVNTNDNNACTTDACDATTGVSHTAVATDDSNPCTTDACNPTTGVSHTPVNTSDNNACTTDACDPTTGITHTAVATDDGNACTTDACDPTTGVSHTPVSTDDADLCTTDACDPSSGVSHTPISSDDNNACTTDSCNPFTGPVHTPVTTTDNNACTTDSCDPASGNITHVDTTDDNNACTTDVCDQSTGVTHTPVATTDNNACTTDSCDPASGNITHVDTTDDNNVCTTDVCDPSTGVTHTPVNMDDGVSCTVDACDPQTGVSHTPNNNACESDGFSCTAPVCNPTTGCSEVPTASVCDDSASCTADSCVGAGGDPNTGCKHQANDTLCSNLLACTSGGCGGAPAQAGHVIVTEFRAVGAEFIEVKNTGTTAVDIHGFQVRNSAGVTEVIRSTSDRSNSANTPVTIAAGARAWGIVNPTGAITGAPDFVIGDPGSTFTLADSGDYIQLFAQDGSTEDIVDFRQFVTDPNVAPGTKFVGFNGRSTQLDSTQDTAIGNDSASAWCVTFYSASSRSRVNDTAGASNGSCSAVVINEVLIDPSSTDDQRAFIELAGPGGAAVGGMVITDVEGRNSTFTDGGVNPVSGSLNTDGDKAPGETDGEFTIPAGTRIPADGILLIADANASGVTLVPNFNAQTDVLARDVDFENGGGDSIQLLRSNVAVDVLGHDTSGTTLDSPTDTTPGRNQPLWEGTIAVTPPANVGVSLARNASSVDTDVNRSDFRADPSPTPGADNDVGFSVTTLTPDDMLAGTTTTSVTLSGSDFYIGTTVKFGSTTATCSPVTSSTQLTCTAPANTVVSRVDVTVTPPPSFGPPVVLTNGFTYTGVLNGTTNPQQADYCNLQFPASFAVTTAQQTPDIFGQLYELNSTEAAGQALGWSAEVGYGATTVNPTTQQGWIFFPASFNVQSGNNDEYVGHFTAPAAGTYSYTYRVSVDNGLNYTYCDLDGAGQNPGATQTFSTTQLGTMTVTP